MIENNDLKDGIKEGQDGRPAIMPRGISAQADVVVGEDINIAGKYRAFRWLAEGEGTLKELTPSQELSDATVLSVDSTGKMIVGMGFIGKLQNPTKARGCLWEEDQPVQLLDPLDSHENSIANQISENRQVIAGSSWTDVVSSRVAVVWNGSATPTPIMKPSADKASCSGFINSTGEFVVGYEYNSKSGSNPQVFRWGKDSGVEIVGPGYPAGISADGQIVAANLQSSPRTFVGVLWQQGKITNVPFLLGCNCNCITTMSPDGKVVIGFGWTGQKHNPTVQRPYIWKQGELTAKDLTSGEASTFGVAADLDEKGEVVLGWRISNPTYTEDLVISTFWENDVEHIMDLPTGYVRSRGERLSRDGNIRVGLIDDGTTVKTFWQKESDPMRIIGPLP